MEKKKKKKHVSENPRETHIWEGSRIRRKLEIGGDHLK